MATKLHTEPRRHYSWWWDSHISPKNSKWLQENLADADMKINTIIKLLEEDADSFARKAEMYYKKRPELMKLVEELYRAYRALAERYDHATGALRQAQRTMAEAFPNQISLLVSDELSYGSVGNDAEPHTPEAPPPLRALFDPDDLQKDALSLSSDLHVIKRNGAYFESNDSLSSKKGLKQLNEMFAFRDGPACTSEGRVRKGLNFQEEEGESSEVRTLMWSRETIQVQEKPDANYVVKGLQQDIAQLSAENENMKNQIMEETDRATRAENELQKLKDTISKLTLEKDAYVTQCQASLQKIATLESHLSATQNELKKVNDEMLTKVNRLQSVEETNQFLMSDLEMPRKKENMLDHELTRKQDELEKLHDSIDEKYQKFMQAEIARYLFEELHTHSMEEITHLSREIEKEIKKSSEMEQCNMDLHKEICKLKEETSRLHEQNIHSSLTIEELKDKIILLEEKNRTFENEVRLCLSDKDTLNQELSRVKDDKILLEENYQDLIKQKELVSIHLDSLEEAVKLLQNENFELKVVTKKQEADKDLLVNKLKDMDIVLGKNVVLEKLLSDAKIELQVLRGNISALEKLHDSLNGEVSTHITEKKELISHAEILNQEVKNLSEKNRFLEKSLCDASSEIGSLRSKLKGFEELFQLFNEQRSDLLAEKNSLLAQIQILTQNVEAHSVENSSLERLLSDITSEVQCLKSKLKVFEESCQSLSDENSELLAELLAERKNFVSQVEILTQDVEKHMDENSFLENSLSDMGSEVEALKEKLKELEESCQCLGRQNTSLLAERNALVSQVEVFTLNVEKLSDKNTTLEYSLSDANSEVGHLRSKLRDYEESMRSLNDQNSGLLAERKFLLSQVENLSQNVEKLSEKNSFMENSLSDVNSEVWCVRSKLKESEEFCRLLSNKNSSLIAERNTILNQVETLTQNVQKLSERNSFLENCLSDIRNEAECLRLKLKEFEKSCQSLSNQNSNLIGERSTVLAQVEILSQNAVKLSEQNLLLEDTLLDIKNEAGCLRSRLTEYEKSCQALSDQNSDLLAERSDLVSQTVALTQNTERLSEKNSLLESSLVAVCNEVGYLKSKLKDSEESCQLLSNENSNFVAERNTLLIQIETLTQNVEKHAERNSILEISLSDVGNELGCLKSKLKDFEKSCQSLSDQNSELLAERRDFITQAEVNTQNVVKFSEKNSLLENLLSAISNEVGCLNSKLKDCGESCQILGDGNSSIVAERNILLIQVKTLALNVEKLSERNSILETSLSDVSNEVGCLRSKLKDYEKFCQSLTDQKSEFLAERNDLIARADVLTQNLEKFSVKNSSLENSLSAVSTEVECLKSKLKDSEESWKSLNDQNSSLLAERSTLSAQVEFLTGNAEKLSEKSSLLESSLSDVSTEVECLRSKLKYSEESNKSVNDQNSCLLAERNDLLSQREVLAKEVEKLSERNSFLEHSVSEVSSEVGPLRSKLKDLESSCLLLNDQNSGLLSERKTILSQLEILTQNGEKLSEKNLYLENTLSDFSAEVVCLKSKLKDFEEKCRSICDQKSSLLIERNTLASQVETITLNLKNLENSFVELKHKYGKLSEERDLLSNQTRDMKNLLKLEKEENETLLQSCKSQLVLLENQNFLMRQENILKEEELEEEQSNIIGALIENFVLERSLCNVNDKNFALSIECQKNLQACRSAELLVSQLEQEKLMHIKTIMSLSEQNEKLIKGICFLQNTLIVEKNFGFLDEDQDKDPLDFIFEQILCSVSKAEYDNQLMHLEMSVLVTLLKHAKLELVSFRLEKCSLERELGIKSQEILSLRKEQSELLGLNENSMKEIEISNQREKDLRTEANLLCDQLNDLQESLRTCKCELLNLIEEKKIMKEQFYELRQIHNLLEEENLEVLAEAMKLDHLCLLFRSLSIEQLMELKSLICDLNSLYSAKNSLISEVNKQKTVIKMLKADNLLLVESLACVEEEFKNNLLLSEFDLFTATFVCEELNLERESIENQLEHTQSHLSEINQKVQSTQLENLNLFKILQGLQLENEATKLVKENLEQKISYLSEVVSHKTEDIRCLGEANEHLQEEIYQKQGEIEVLMRREEGLLSKLQKEMYENEPCEAEIESLLSEIHLSTFSAALYEDRVIELMIEEEVSSVMRKEMLIAEVALVKEYVDSLNRKLDFGEVESQGLKSRLDIHSSLVTSLWNEIAFLEKQIVGAAKLKLAIHHKKEHNDSQPSECHEAINDECVSMLEKLISKVKALEEVFMHTLNDREQEKPVASTNLVSTETEVLRRKELGLQQEVQLSKNLNRKFDVGLNDVEMSKGKNGLIIKDIELDQDSSSLPRRTIGSYGLGRINIDEIDDQLWEAAEKNYSNRIPKASTVSVEHDIEPVEEEKSEYPSSELMFEESSIDKYQIPKSAFASRQEWNKRLLRRLTTDSQRLSDLRTTATELKRRMDASQMGKLPSSLGYDKVQTQLKDAQGSVEGLIDMNRKLTNKAEEYSPVGIGSESEDSSSTGRKQISEQARKESEKIGRLELELHKIQYVMLKLEEEHASRQIKASDRRASTLLRDYIYGRRRDGRGKTKNSPFCGCIRPRTKG